MCYYGIFEIQDYYSCVSVAVDFVLQYYNSGHNLLILFDTLPNFAFTTSETKSDY